ncbi:alpha/beta fold hydrolase [Streptomyces orinoci]|uniref:Alpha/beta hydrolase n=1 Tax=Streptomyces orinoci TaxID=67339 RepID=A0ABV3JYI4_STRON|nr:alpha/beta hydrolase [Streptomyces orinoci]
MRTIELPAGVIEYQDEGSGPPVVLLHGLLMDHTVWDRVMPLLPREFRYVRPVLPLGAHRRPMRTGADLSLRGQVRLVADFLEALGLEEITLVHSDWGGALFLTAHGWDQRVARQVILPCEAFDNFPPGLPGRMLTVAVRVPGGLGFAVRQLRIGALRRLPVLFGLMARRPLPDALVRRWTDPFLRIPGVRRDMTAYCHGRLDKRQLIQDTEALRRFTGEALVLWSPDNRVMPPAHGRRLAELLPAGRYAEVPGAYVLSMLDEPEAVARKIGAFLTSPGTSSGTPSGPR